MSCCLLYSQGLLLPLGALGGAAPLSRERGPRAQGRLGSVRAGFRPGGQPGPGVSGLRSRRPVRERVPRWPEGGRCALRGDSAPPGGPILLGTTSGSYAGSRPSWAAGGTSLLTTRSAGSRLPRRAPPGVHRHRGPVCPVCLGSAGGGAEPGERRLSGAECRGRRRRPRAPRRDGDRDRLPALPQPRRLRLL